MLFFGKVEGEIDRVMGRQMRLGEEEMMGIGRWGERQVVRVDSRGIGREGQIDRLGRKVERRKERERKREVEGVVNKMCEKGVGKLDMERDLRRGDVERDGGREKDRNRIEEK